LTFNGFEPTHFDLRLHLVSLERRTRQRDLDRLHLGFRVSLLRVFWLGHLLLSLPGATLWQNLFYWLHFWLPVPESPLLSHSLILLSFLDIILKLLLFKSDSVHLRLLLVPLFLVWSHLLPKRTDHLHNLRRVPVRILLFDLFSFLTQLILNRQLTS
jgi:hypothetical protein